MSQAIAYPSVTPSFPPLAYQGVPVLTTEMLAQAYEVEAKQIRQNFANNRERFVEGKHFFIITNGELKNFRLQVENFDSQISPKVRSLTLWTERGAARNAKMLNSGRAWDVFELLEETFFRVVRADATPVTSPDAAISPAERAELKAIVDAKLSTYPAAVQGKARAEIWTRFNRHFKIAEYAQLPAAKMPDARDYLIQMNVKALQPAQQPVAAALPAAQASAATEHPATGQHMACLLLIEDVRERLRTTCHPGAVTMKMTPQERRVYYACHAAYVAADEALAGAYSILDAGRRMAEAIRA